jgi:hypothetical protein
LLQISFHEKYNVYCKITPIHCFQSGDGEGAVGGGGSSAESSVSSGDVDDSFEGKDSDKEGKKKKNRCAVCRKKVGLTGACHMDVLMIPLSHTLLSMVPLTVKICMLYSSQA